MLRYYIVSGILLIIPVALAAPVLVQEKRQAGIEAMHIPEDAITTLGKRGDGLDQLWLKYVSKYENHFPATPEEPKHEWTDVSQPLPPIPEHPLTESGHESTEEDSDAPPVPGRRDQRRRQCPTRAKNWWGQRMHCRTTQGRRQTPTMNGRGSTRHCRAQCSRRGFTQTMDRWGRMRPSQT